jgi:hypothetical protein
MRAVDDLVRKFDAYLDGYGDVKDFDSIVGRIPRTERERFRVAFWNRVTRVTGMKILDDAEEVEGSRYRGLGRRRRRNWD